MRKHIRILGVGTLAVVAVSFMALGTPARPGDSPAVPSLVATGNGVTLHSVSVDLPTGNFSFDVPSGADALGTNCVACHSTGMILNQPPLTQAQWAAEVAHMRRDFKAPIAEADVPAIVAELFRLRGAK